MVDRRPFNCIGTQDKLSVTTAAVVTLTLPARTTKHALIAVQNNGIRYTTDGTTPVTGAPGTGVGQPVAAGATISFMDANIDYANRLLAFKMIGNGGTAIIDAAFFD